MTCRECDRYKIQLHLHRNELLLTPVHQANRLEELCDAIDQLEIDYLVHRNHCCYYWSEWPKVEPCLAFVERLN